MQATADHPRRHRLTVADYYRMAEIGILAHDARVELVDGEIIDMVPPGSLHAAAVTRLTEVFIRAVAGQAIVLAQNPVRLSEYSEPQPDQALLVPRADYYSAHHPRPADVLLVVEVADTSLSYDRDTKAPLYASHGIRECWLVDLPGQRLLRHRNPEHAAYTKIDEPDPGSPLEIAALPGVSVSLKGLFG